MAAASMDTPDVDVSIHQALARGEVKRAAQLLVLHHADAVYATCRALVRQPALAEDLSQETFTRAIAALPTFRGEARSRTWLLSIARHACIDHLRKSRGAIDERVELDADAHPAETPPPFDLLVRRGEVERSLAVLGETERAIVVLHHAHGVGYPELASSFGIAEGALRMRMSRALLKMRDALAEPTAQVALGASDGAPSRGRAAPAAAPAPMPAMPRAASAPPAMGAPAGPSRSEGGRSEGVLDRLGAWWRGPSATPPPASLWPAPEPLRRRLLQLAV